MYKVKFKNSIKTKIISTVIIYSLIVAIIISSINLFFTYKYCRSEVMEKMVLIPQSYSKDFDNNIKIIENTVDNLEFSILARLKEVDFKNLSEKDMLDCEAKVDYIIKNTANTTYKQSINKIEGVYFVFNPELSDKYYESWFVNKAEDGVFCKEKSNSLQGNSLSNDELSWYTDAVSKKSGVWSKPYTDSDINKSVISYTKALYVNDMLLGVVGVDLNINSILERINRTKIYKAGYSFICDENYNLMISPKCKNVVDEKVKSKLKTLNRRIKSKKTALVKCTINNEDNLLGYSYLSNGWIFVTLSPTNDIYSSLKVQLVITIIIILMSVICIISIMLYITNHITNPIIDMTKLVKSTTDFDFDNDPYSEVLLQRKDEIGVMSNEIVNMRKMLKDTRLDTAAKLQIHSLQNYFPLEEKAKMNTLYVPAKGVSGDFFHIQAIDDSTAIGLLWDVSGKGVIAALSTSAMIVLFSEVLEATSDPVEILNKLNSKISSILDDTYIAACCFKFDFRNNIMNIASAGINELMVNSKEYSYEKKEIKGPFLGMFSDSIFDEMTINFKSGDQFFFFTDGLENVFNNDEIKVQYQNIATTRDLIAFLQQYIDKEKEKHTSLADDSTCIAIEIN